MIAPVLVDTGALVALINARDQYHPWAQEVWGQIRAPLLTCEPVITEACFLVQQIVGGETAVLQFVERQIVQIPLALSAEVVEVKALMMRYRSVPMSLADACLVRLSEIYENGQVLTLDSDFRIYRKHVRQVIPVIMPD